MPACLCTHIDHTDPYVDVQSSSGGGEEEGEEEFVCAFPCLSVEC